LETDTLTIWLPAAVKNISSHLQALTLISWHILNANVQHGKKPTASFPTKLHSATINVVNSTAKKSHLSTDLVPWKARASCGKGNQWKTAYNMQNLEYALSSILNITTPLNLGVND